MTDPSRKVAELARTMWDAAGGREMNEAAVTSQSIARIGALPGCVFGRNNTGALRDPSGRLVRYGLGHTAAGLDGSPDYVGCVGGLFVAIEFKRTRGGRLSAGQQRWIDAWRSNGAAVAVVRDPDEAVVFVEGVRRRAAFLAVAESYCDGKASQIELLEAFGATLAAPDGGEIDDR